MPALATFAGALVFAVIGIVLALGAFIVIWKDGIKAAGHAFAAIAIGVALLAYPAYLGVRAYQLPMINDITTDPLDPPRFDVLARLRPRGTVEYAGLYAAEQQRAAYPDIEPLSVTATPADRLRGGARRSSPGASGASWSTGRRSRPPRRPDRSGGAHADHGFPRRRRGARARRRATARASTCARPRATAATISAPTPRASAACSRTSTTRSACAPTTQSGERQKPPAKAGAPPKPQPAKR